MYYSYIGCLMGTLSYHSLRSVNCSYSYAGLTKMASEDGSFLGYFLYRTTEFCDASNVSAFNIRQITCVSVSLVKLLLRAVVFT